MSIPKKNIASRYPDRTSKEKALIYKILDEGRFCTVAYVRDGKPYQLPTGYCRMEDKLFIHGSSASQFLEDILTAGEVCISVMIFDGLVLAPTAFNHSVNYRSVVTFSQPEKVETEERKVAFFKAFTEKYIPGRMSELEDPSLKEISKTTVLSFGLNGSTSKVRTGPAGVNTAKSEVWSGVVPATLAYGLPEPDKGLKKSIAVPKYLTEMVVKSNA